MKRDENQLIVVQNIPLILANETYYQAYCELKKDGDGTIDNLDLLHTLVTDLKEQDFTELQAMDALKIRERWIDIRRLHLLLDQVSVPMLRNVMRHLACKSRVKETRKILLDLRQKGVTSAQGATAQAEARVVYTGKRKPKGMFSNAVPAKAKKADSEPREPMSPKKGNQ
jgi:hypothetical protein